MANAIAARQHGDNYQARHFWNLALPMLATDSDIATIAYDFSDRKAFDDVVITYDPPRGQTHQEPLSTHYMQVKWQANQDHEFGYADLIDPKFINASKVSLLERLQDAQTPNETSARYTLVTTARVKANDPLLSLINNIDGTLRLKDLKKGGPDSKMGLVRSLWCTALKLSNEEQLFDVLKSFAILDNQPNLEGMRELVSTVARSVGLQLAPNSASDFRPDALARELIQCGYEDLNRKELLSFLAQEGLKPAASVQLQAQFTDVLIKSFDRLATDVSKFDTVIDLTQHFEGRYLDPSCTWQEDVVTPIIQSLRTQAQKSSHIRIAMDAHASVAFACGRVLHLKSGVRSEIYQNGRKGPELWHAEDGQGDAPQLDTRLIDLGAGDEIAVSVSVAQPTENAVLAFVQKSLPKAGKVLSCHLPSGPSQIGISGGHHAAKLSDQLAGIVKSLRETHDISRVHLFVAAPNALLFYLGQQAQSLGRHQMYEYDMDGDHGGSYVASISD
ncbi:SAVED domain-containing protein [Sulfitobacter litoralis]|uniref:SAVED domain-containing protein n=1 Tax=Sulfitobacter litoralis TaxID=335975 RepID=UPI002356DFF2|nr:SAVED domain-containing protein [Sulfitobacter litoralis]